MLSDIVCTILIVRVIVNMSGFNVQFMRIQECMVGEIELVTKNPH